jgi:ABC-type nitrate/sulfonate/bicarbonate transport system ATPase subunit
MTVKENLLIVNKDVALVEKALADFYLTDKQDCYPSQLSAGQAQRVSIARAVCYDANLLLMDEPFINLDVGLKQRLIETIKNDHIKRGNTVVLVTHDILECVSLADRIIVLSNGKVVEDISSVNEKTEKYLFGLMVKIFESQNA